MHEWIYVTKKEQDDDTYTMALEIVGSGCLVCMRAENDRESNNNFERGNLLFR